MRCHTFGDAISDPPADRLGLFVRIGEDLDRRGWAVEDGHGTAAVLGIAVDIRDRGWQQPVGLRADLVRGAVVDAERVRSAADVNAEREPRERLLKDPLTQVAGKEQAVRAGANERREKPQFGDRDVLRLIDNGKIEWRPSSGGDVLGDPPEQIGPAHGVPFGETGAHPLKNRPQDLALSPADPGLAAEPGNVAVLVPSSYLPGIDNLAPFAGQKPQREAVPLDPAFAGAGPAAACRSSASISA